MVSIILVIPDAMVGGVNFLYVKIILQDGTKSDQDITWLRRSRSKEIQEKTYQQNPNILENLTVTVSFR